MATESEQLVVQLEARVRDFEKNFQRASRTADTSWQRIERRGRDAGVRMERDTRKATAGVVANFTRMGAGIGRALMGVAGIGTVGAGAIGVTVQRIVAETSELGKVADRLGVGTEALQEFRYAAQLAGISQNTFDMALQRFTRRAAEAAQGTGEAKDALAQLGIQLTDASGTLRPAEELLSDVADALTGIQNPAERVRLAFKLFDSEGVSMVNMLRNGARGLEEMREQARQAGVVLEDDLVRAAERVDDKFATLTKSIGTSFKAAVLTAVDSVDLLLDRFKSLENQTSRPMLEAQLNTLNAERDALNAERDRLSRIPRGPDGRVDPVAERGLASIERRIQGIDQEYTAVLDRIGQLGQSSTTTPATLPPRDPADDDDDSRSRSTIATREQRDAAAELITTLERELSLLSATDAERLIANSLRLAGADATDEQRAKIEALTQALYAGEMANMRAAQAADFFGSVAFDALDDLIFNARSAEDVVDSLARTIARAALEAALLGSGPLAGLLGTATGGGILGAVLPRFHSGGIVGGSGPSEIVAKVQRGEHILTATDAGRTAATLDGLTRAVTGMSGGGSVVVSPEITINVEGSSRGGPEADQELAQRIGQHVEGSVRAVVASELRTQMRPGGMLRR